MSLRGKLLSGVLGIALVSAAGYNVVQAIENRHLFKQVDSLDTRINDPKTGYVVRLTQAETNEKGCTATVVRQSATIRGKALRDAATAAAIQSRYDVEHGLRLQAERDAAAFLARKPHGVTLGDRVVDVDAAILGDLN